MAEWISFIHPPRENFAATMTDAEKAAWSDDFERFQRLLATGGLRPLRVSLLRGRDRGL